MRVILAVVALTALVAVQALDPESVKRQEKVLSLFEGIGQNRRNTDWWKTGNKYDVEANIDKYTDKEAVDEFLRLYRSGFMPKYETFSVFYDDMREDAIALFNLLYYAKDFDTFYKTAAFARVHLNDDQFLYAYYIAIYMRPDTRTLVVPAVYNLFPKYFVSTKTFLKAYRMKLQNGNVDPAYASQYGIFNEGNQFVFYSNYTSPSVTGSTEDKLSYFTEDIGLNSFYYYIKTLYPFWRNEAIDDDNANRGNLLYFIYRQLIGTYYLNRLTNGMGEIPEFSFSTPIRTGYYCDLSTYYPFFQRNDYYQIQKVENKNNLQYLNNYEKSFLSYLEQRKINANNQSIALGSSRASNGTLNFDIFNYWFTHVDQYSKMPKNYEYVGLHLLAGTPDPVDNYTVLPSALELYQTSLRDPVFFQFYNHMLKYFVQWQKYLEPNSGLRFDGVMISDVKVDELVTYFDFYDFDITNEVYHSVEEFRVNNGRYYKVRQPRLNHKPFTVTVNVESNVTTDALFKIFLGPNYDSYRLPLSIEDNWMNFVELDWFVQNLTPGQNKVERKSTTFALYRQDDIPTTDTVKLLKQGEVPLEMPENMFYQPNRLMLPKGVKSGFPFQMYVVAYPYTPLSRKIDYFSKYFPDTKPIGYPFDRPVYETFFKQPNIYRKDVLIYHEGEEFANVFNVKGYYPNYKN